MTILVIVQVYSTHSDMARIAVTLDNYSNYTHVCESVALLVARRTNNRKVVGSRPTKSVYHGVEC